MDGKGKQLQACGETSENGHGSPDLEIDTKNLYRLPNGKQLLDRLSLTQERLLAGTKIALPIPVLRLILTAAIAGLPFDRQFYLSAYPDIRDAFNSGEMPDVHRHFIETGYFEGRLACMPEVDEEFYKKTYPDVAAAIASGKMRSALDHYFLTGAAEGRHPNEHYAEASTFWRGLADRT